MTHNKKRKMFVHAHIPKSGGTTFRRILKKNFGQAFKSENGLISFQYDRDQMEKGIREHPALRAYSSHHTSFDLPYKMKDREVIAITFVRDPVERFISHYFHHRNTKKASVPAIKKMNFREYLEAYLVTGKQSAYINGQVKFLSGDLIYTDNKNLMSNNQVNHDSINKLAMVVEDRKALIFPLARFDEVSVVLERMFPKDFKDCSYSGAKNVTPRDQEVTQEDRELIAQNVGEFDIELLKMADKLLDELISELCSSDLVFGRELQDLKRRGEASIKKDNIYQLARKIGEKVLGR